MTIIELKNLLSRFHIRPDKSLGQNFLLSEKALEEILSAAALSKNDTVLEIGPGLGVLTAKLSEQVREVVAVEKDRKIAAVLRKTFKNRKNVKIVCEDALFFDPNEIAEQNPQYKLVANIPYYITGKLLQTYLTAKAKPQLMVLLVQKEVAERITAKPGDLSILGVSAQFYADAEIISYVSKDSFYPIPQVDSAVIKLRVLDKPRLDVDEKHFFRLVKAGFSNKRKQLQNNLTALSSGQKIDYKVLLASIGLNPLARAQDLSLDDWQKLYNSLLT